MILAGAVNALWNATYLERALIALARQRVNVLWAMLRDGSTFESRSAA
jgi:hypothetical protein